MKQNKLRIAVIGVGHLGEYHVQKYKGIPEVELVGVVDVDADRVTEIAQRYDTKAYGDHRDILDRVDAVSLAVTTEMHFEVAKDILKKGIHMLIEKHNAPVIDAGALKNPVAVEQAVVENRNDRIFFVHQFTV